MARSVEEIFEFLSDGQGIADTFRKIDSKYTTWILPDKDVRSMEMSKIEDFEKWISH